MQTIGKILENLSNSFVNWYHSQRPGVRDYLISLVISAGIVCIIIIAIVISDYSYQQKYVNEVYSLTHTSKNISESIKAGLFLNTYQLNEELSTIDSLRIRPLKQIWIEKESDWNYIRDEEGNSIHLSDSIRDDYILHVGDLFEDKLFSPIIGSYNVLWKDFSTMKSIGNSFSYSQQLIDNCPDTLAVIITASEYVYKGNICLVKD